MSTVSHVKYHSEWRKRPVPAIDIPVRIFVAVVLAFGAGASAGMYTYTAMQVAPHTVQVESK